MIMKLAAGTQAGAAVPASPPGQTGRRVVAGAAGAGRPSL